MSTKSRNDEDKWNETLESAWLPDDLPDKTRAPWEMDVNFPSTEEEIDVEANAFVEDMKEHWDERRGKAGKGRRRRRRKRVGESRGESLYSVETVKKDYRLKKQRVHASLWVKEIEKLEEAKLGDSGEGGADDMVVSVGKHVRELKQNDFDPKEKFWTRFSPEDVSGIIPKWIQLRVYASYLWKRGA